jgi:hypothetical protein
MNKDKRIGAILLVFPFLVAGVSYLAFEGTARIFILIPILVFSLVLLAFLLPLSFYFFFKKTDEQLTALQTQPKYQNLSLKQLRFIYGWSWGAFFGSFIWAFGNRLYIWGLLYFIPLVNIFVFFKMCIRGRATSWENSEWGSYEAFGKRQATMAKTILAIMIVGAILNKYGGLNSLLSTSEEKDVQYFGPAEDKSIELTLNQLYEDYYEHPNQIEEEYRNQWLEVAGEYNIFTVSWEIRGYSGVTLKTDSYLTSEAKIKCEFNEDILEEEIEFEDYLIVRGKLGDEVITNPFTGEISTRFVLDYCEVVSNTAEPTDKHLIQTEPLSLQVPEQEINEFDLDEFFAELVETQEDEDLMNDQYLDQWIKLEAEFTESATLVSSSGTSYAKKFKVMNETDDTVEFTSFDCDNVDPAIESGSLPTGEPLTLLGMFSKYSYSKGSEKRKATSLLSFNSCTFLDLEIDESEDDEDLEEEDRISRTSTEKVEVEQLPLK